MKLHIKIKFFFSIVIFVFIFVLQILFYSDIQNYEDVHVEGEFTLAGSLIPTQYRGYVKILKPENSDLKQKPVIILLHGDFSVPMSLNLLKLEFLRNDYIVAILTLDGFGIRTFFVLNDTLNYLLNRNDVNKSQIGIFGHSHGGQFALIFSTMRNESINSVICANFGRLEDIHRDYYHFYQNFVLKDPTLPFRYTDFLKANRTMSLPNMKYSNNILLIADSLDRVPDDNLSNYMSEFSNGCYDQINTLYGNFHDDTARKLYVSTTVFTHFSSIIYPEAIFEAVSWSNLSLGIQNKSDSLYFIFLNFCLLIILFFAQLILGHIVFAYYIQTRNLERDWAKIIKYLSAIYTVIALMITIGVIYSMIS
jgi:pimeloyl-ACP methyl ester carboxylesterase